LSSSGAVRRNLPSGFCPGPLGTHSWHQN